MRAVALVVLWPVCVSPLRAQLPADTAVRAAIARFAVGDRIRVHRAQFTRISGTLLSADTSHVVIALGGVPGSRAVVPTDVIDSVWEWTPTPHPVPGLIAGTVLGFVAGIVVSLTVNGVPDRPHNGLNDLAIPITMSLASAAVGASIGMKAHSWRRACPVPPSPSGSPPDSAGANR